jgi:hypothetical protein
MSGLKELISVFFSSFSNGQVKQPTLRHSIFDLPLRLAAGKTAFYCEMIIFPFSS